MSKYLIISIILAITLLATFRLVRPGYFPMYDDMQVVRLYEMDQCFKDLQIPCRWVPNLGFGYGYPIYEYYAPLPYYLMELVHLTGVSFLDSIKIGFILSVFFSGLFFYLLVRYFFTIPVALATTFFYVITPFRATDLYVRGAMGELWGMAALPLLFWGLEKLLRSKGRLPIVNFSICCLIFLVTHNLTVLMATVLFVPWVTIRLWQSDNPKAQFLRVFNGGLLGVGLAGFFILPLIFEGHLVHTETLTQGYFNYLAHFATLNQLLISTHFGYGPSVLGPGDDSFLGVGPIHFLLGSFGFLTLAFHSRKNLKSFLQKNLLWVNLMVVFFLVLFLSHQRSSFIWNFLPFLSYMQFPWRFVIIALFSLTVLSGLFFENVRKYSKWVILFFVVATTWLYGGFFSPKEWFNLTDQEKLTGQMWQNGITASIYDYLPKSASIAPNAEAPKTLIVDRGDVDVRVAERGTNWFKYLVRVDSEKSTVVIPTYDFPGWTVLVDNTKVDYTRFGKLGLLSFDLLSGEHQIEAYLAKTLPRTAGDTLTIFSFGICLLILIKEKRVK